MKIPGGLSLEEWIEYWREGSRQHVEDGSDLDQIEQKEVG